MLHVIADYAEHQLADSEPGFKTREIRWIVEIAGDGRILGIVPLGDGKRGLFHDRCPDMHGLNAGAKSHFLIETIQTITLLYKANEEPKKIAGTEKKHQFYSALIRAAATDTPALVPLGLLLDNPSRLDEIRAAFVAAKAKPTDWMGWHIDGKDPRLDANVQAWWREWRRRDLGLPEGNASRSGSNRSMLCFLTGTDVEPLATHKKIEGLSGVGGLGTGDVMMGFDKAAFGSYALDQSANAAMSAQAAQLYVDGLNDLIRNHSRKLGNALVVHWFKDRVPFENDPLEFLYALETDESVESAALGAARRLLQSISSGERPDLGQNRYYAMTLSGASGRVMVRDWMEGEFVDLVRHVEAWFSDLAIVFRYGGRLAPDPKFMAVCGALVRDLKDLPAPTIASLWRSAAQQLPIPRSAMSRALARFRADLVDKDQPPINHARMGLIKAYFVRLKPGGDPNMTAYLNPEHSAPAYHCGRLLAVLANLQRRALGDVGAGVVQRYYAAASQTPGLVLGRLVSNARNHLGKLEGGLAYWYESQIADVMVCLKDSAPRILDLEGQGLFALGYYQQLAALRAGNKSNSNETTTDQGESR